MDVAAIVARVDEWTNQPESRERFYEQVRRYADLIERRAEAVQRHKAACLERVREVLRRGHLDERERPAAADDRWVFRGYPVWAPPSPALARVRGRAEHPLTKRREGAAAKALLAALDEGGNRGTAPYEVVCWLPPQPPDPSDPDHWAPSKQLAPNTPLALRVPRLGEADALTVAYAALLSLRNRQLGRPRLPEGLTAIQAHHMQALAGLYERHAEEMLRWVASDLEACDADYRPATWFPKGMAARLRMAASERRKGKRVATRIIDGVVCYSVADARRWWPNDVPKES